jgi:hypothetical protein
MKVQAINLLDLVDFEELEESLDLIYPPSDMELLGSNAGYQDEQNV